MALRKPEKGDYANPGAWRPLRYSAQWAKIIEAVAAQQLRRLAEQYNMLPAQQMGARQNRSTMTALDLLVNQVHTIWESGDYVASLLSLDIVGAFDRVVRKRLAHVLRAKGIPSELVEWVQGFMTERTATIITADKEAEEFKIAVGVPQGSPLSPKLYLFYVAELLDSCNSSADRLSASGFVDDTTLLTYGRSTESNCRTLKRAHPLRQVNMN